MNQKELAERIFVGLVVQETHATFFHEEPAVDGTQRIESMETTPGYFADHDDELDRKASLAIQAARAFAEAWAAKGGGVW